MPPIWNKFDRLSDGDKMPSMEILVAILTLVLSIFTGAISYFGYSINKAMEVRNRIDWEVQQAEHRKEFWKDIELVEKTMFKQTESIGEDLAEYQMAYFELLNEIGRLEAQKRNISLSNQDIKFLAAFAKLVSKYASLQSSIEMIGVKYDNSILTNTPLVKPLGIQCWNLYLDEGEKISKWKSKVLESYHESYNLIYSAIKSGELPNAFESRVQDVGYKMGYVVKELSPPSLQGLLTLKAKNHPRYNKSKHFDAVSCAGV